MQSKASLALAGSLVVLLAGCAGQTTDPRQGGLFSYNPDAYNQRLQERQSHLSQVEQDNRVAEDQALSLESERTAREKENSILRAKIKKLSASAARLEKDIKAKEALDCIRALLTPTCWRTWRPTLRCASPTL